MVTLSRFLSAVTPSVATTDGSPLERARCTAMLWPDRASGPMQTWCQRAHDRHLAVRACANSARCTFERCYRRGRWARGAKPRTIDSGQIRRSGVVVCATNTLRARKRVRGARIKAWLAPQVDPRPGFTAPGPDWFALVTVGCVVRCCDMPCARRVHGRSHGGGDRSSVCEWHTVFLGLPGCWGTTGASASFAVDTTRLVGCLGPCTARGTVGLLVILLVETG